ncbi:MAG: TylF/MycF/NovP-related O-methyltransferase [Propionibacteriaceae bacterium]
MNWKRNVNDFLTKTAGYELRRAGAPARTRLESKVAAQQARIEALEAKIRTQQGAGAKKKSAERPMPSDYDQEMQEIIRAVRPYTMTGNGKMHALVTAVRYVTRHQIPGAIVECGVWRGGSMHAAVRVLEAAQDTSRDLYLFDTFEGMPPPTEADRRNDGTSAEQLLARSSKQAAVWAYASLADVQQGFEQFSYPEDKIHFVQGKVEDTIPEQAPEQISVLRLDTDWYESTAHELEHLYPRLVSGGVLMIDDYGYWQGSRKATDEFLERTGEQLMLIRMDSGRVAIKR